MFVDENIIQVLTLFFAFLTICVAAAFMFFNLQKKHESKYNNLQKRVELDSLRQNYETQIYELMAKLSKKETRFKEINELQLNGNPQNITNNPVMLNNFLISAGITDEDIHIKNYVFVLTPFHKDFIPSYEAIKKVCDSADIKCIRGDEKNFKGDIFSNVLKNIIQSKLIIANISGRNPNVMYELGLAHALDKNVILVAETLSNVPVDLQSKRIVTYQSLEDLEKLLPIELLKILK
jgi:hypothetical protein